MSEINDAKSRRASQKRSLDLRKEALKKAKKQILVYRANMAREKTNTNNNNFSVSIMPNIVTNVPFYDTSLSNMFVKGGK